MALSSKIKKLIKEEKWKEAYDLASGEQSAEDNSFLVTIQDSTKSKKGDGYIRGDEKKYSIVTDAEKASSFTKKDAKDISRKIKKEDRKNITTSIIERSSIIQNVGSQGTEKGEVIDLFLKKRFPKKSIKSIKDFVTKWIEELGFSDTTNPFFSFIDDYINKYESIDRKTMEIINDLYSNGEIETTDLQAKTREGINHIIFNKNLYKFDYEKVEFVVQAYKWLSIPTNISSYMTNAEALTKYNISDIKNISKQKAIEIRNQIIFENAQSPSSSEIRDVNEMEEDIKSFEGGGTKKIDKDETSKKTIVINSQIQDSAKWRNIVPSDTTAQEAQDLMNYLAKEFKLV